jgi:hypothetical protein
VKVAAFSPAQYQAVTDKINSGINTVTQEKLPEFVSVTNSLLGEWYIPGFVKDTVKWLVEELIKIADAVISKIGELLKGAAIPVYMFDYAWNWEDIKGTATGVESELVPGVVGLEDWKGQAASVYTSAIQPQSQAAAQIGAIADSTANSLWTCAAAGMAFYVALGVIVYQLIAALAAAIAAVGSIIFSWAGLAMVVSDAGISTGLIIAAVSTLSALLGVQASQMVSLHGKAVDETAFPGGRWPVAANLGATRISPR